MQRLRIAEDERTLRRSLQRGLMQSGYEVPLMESSSEASSGT